MKRDGVDVGDAARSFATSAGSQESWRRPFARQPAHHGSDGAAVVEEAAGIVAAKGRRYPRMPATLSGGAPALPPRPCRCGPRPVRTGDEGGMVDGEGFPNRVECRLRRAVDVEATLAVRRHRAEPAADRDRLALAAARNLRRSAPAMASGAITLMRNTSPKHRRQYVWSDSRASHLMPGIANEHVDRLVAQRLAEPGRSIDIGDVERVDLNIAGQAAQRLGARRVAHGGDDAHPSQRIAGQLEAEPAN